MCDSPATNSIECADKHETKEIDKPKKDKGKIAIILSLGLDPDDCDEEDILEAKKEAKEEKAEEKGKKDED